MIIGRKKLIGKEDLCIVNALYKGDSLLMAPELLHGFKSITETKYGI